MKWWFGSSDAVIVHRGRLACIRAILGFCAIHGIDQSHASLNLFGYHFKHVFDSLRNTFGSIFYQCTLLVTLSPALRLIQRDASSNDENSVDDASNEIGGVGESPEPDEQKHV